ncbi:transcriptional regulator, partial [Stenotrophomonas maltophilia]
GWPAIAPEPLVAEDLAAGRLVAPWGFAATGGFWVLAQPDGPPDARVDALADWLGQQLR